MRTHFIVKRKTQLHWSSRLCIVHATHAFNINKILTATTKHAKNEIYKNKNATLIVCVRVCVALTYSTYVWLLMRARLLVHTHTLHSTKLSVITSSFGFFSLSPQSKQYRIFSHRAFVRARNRRMCLSLSIQCAICVCTLTLREWRWQLNIENRGIKQPM